MTGLRLRLRLGRLLRVAELRGDLLAVATIQTALGRVSSGTHV